MNRIEKLQRKGETLLVEKEIDLFYLTGIRMSAGALLIKPEEACLIVDGRYFEMCRQKATVPVLLEEPITVEGVLCFDAQATSYARFLELQKLGFPLNPVDSPVTKLRMIKEPEEIALLKKAAKLGAEGFSHVKSLLKEGVTESQLALELEIFWKKRGAKGVAFEPIIAFGPNSAMPHYRNGPVALRKGMNVLIDIGVNLDNYLSDMTRVLFFGEPDPQLKAIYAIVAEGQKEALALCRPGIAIGRIDEAARDSIAKAGYHLGHSLGHGVGLEIHEWPSLKQKPPFSEMALEPGMVITIEPGIYIPQLGGVRLEDTIVITENGYENITNIDFL